PLTKPYEGGIDTYGDQGPPAARDALVRIGPAAIPALTQALENKDALTRVNAAWALWKSEQQPDVVLPVLLAAWPLCSPSSLLVGMLQAQSRLPDVVARHRYRQRPLLLDELVQVGAVHVLHCEVMRGADLAGVEGDDDMGMDELSGGRDFMLETSD